MEKDLVTRLQALEMTRKELAQSLGVSLSSIYHWRELPKYVEAYLDARFREHGLDMSSLHGGVESVSATVQLSGGEGAVDAGKGGRGDRANPVPERRSAPLESGRRRG